MLTFENQEELQILEDALFYIRVCAESKRCCLRNRFHVAVHLFSNRSQMTSKCDEDQKSRTWAIRRVRLMFWAHFGVFFDLLRNRPTATWNPFVLYHKEVKQSTVMSLMPLAPDVQTLDSAIHRINHYPPDNSIGFAGIYPLDSDISGGQLSIVWTTRACSRTM